MSFEGRKMRMLFVTSCLEHGGAERHTITLFNRLAERGHECHAVLIKDDVAQLDRVRARGNATVRSLDAQRFFDVRALAAFARALAASSPSVVVAVNDYALLYSTIALRWSRVRAALAVVYHASDAPGAKEQLKMAAYRPLFWAADCAIFVCNYQRRRWLWRGVAARRNEVIHNGVDLHEFTDRTHAGERLALRRHLGFHDGDYVLGITAALRPEKNHTQLVDAVAGLRASGIPARALLIGDGPMRAEIDARARAKGVAEHVKILGFKTDVRPYVLACDTAVLCSLTESLPLAAIEAMALGRPVVHSNVGGAAELVTPGLNGFLFRVNDTERLVEHLASLANPFVRERMGRNARATVEQSFAEQPMIDRYERVLGELAAARMPGTAVTAPALDGSARRWS
jgi:glycosyltransferase involved in cell wall biosynthesis